MVKRWHSAMVPASCAPARKAPKQGALEVSAEEPLAVRSCIASTALVGDEANLSVCTCYWLHQTCAINCQGRERA